MEKRREARVRAGRRPGKGHQVRGRGSNCRGGGLEMRAGAIIRGLSEHSPPAASSWPLWLTRTGPGCGRPEWGRGERPDMRDGQAPANDLPNMQGSQGEKTPDVTQAAPPCPTRPPEPAPMADVRYL